MSATFWEPPAAGVLRLPLWLAFPWVLFIIVSTTLGNAAYEHFVMGVPLSLGLILSCVVLYVVLFALSAIIALQHQPSWHDDVRARDARLNESAQRELVAYNELRAHDFSAARRPPPFAAHDAAFAEALHTCHAQLAALQAQPAVLYPLLRERRGWWVPSLCNLVMFVFYLRLRRQLERIEITMHAASQSVAAAQTIREAIRTAHHPVQAELEAIAGALLVANRKLAHVQAHTPEGIVHLVNGLEVCAAAIRAAERACKVYALFPYDSATWVGLANAAARTEQLRQRIAAFDRELDALEGLHAYYLAQLTAAETAANLLKEALSATCAGHPHVSTHRYELVLQQSARLIVGWRDERGSKARYEHISAEATILQMMLADERAHLERKRAALTLVTVADERLQRLAKRLAAARVTIDGLDNVALQCEQVRSHINQCRVRLCEAINDAWEFDTSAERMRQAVDAPIEQVGHTLDRLEQLRAERDAAWELVRSALDALEGDLHAPELAATAMGVGFARAALTAGRAFLVAALGERESEAHYGEQGGRAAAMTRSIDETRATLASKIARLADVNRRERWLEHWRSKRVELGRIFSDNHGWIEVDATISALEQSLAHLRAAFAPQPSAAEEIALWRAPTEPEALARVADIPLRAVAGSLKQSEERRAAYDQQLARVKTALDELDGIISAQPPERQQPPADIRIDTLYDRPASVDEFATWVVEQRGRLPALAATATHTAHIAHATDDLVKLATQARRQRRTLLWKRRALAAVRNEALGFAQLEREVETNATARISQKVSDALGSGDTIDEALRNAARSLVTPGADWQTSVRNKALARTVRKPVAERREQLDMFYQQASNLRSTFQQAKAAIDELDDTIAQRVSDQRVVNLTEFANRLDGYKTEIERLRPQVYDRGDPKGFRKLEGTLDVLGSEAAAQKQRLDDKRELAEQIRIRQAIAATWRAKLNALADLAPMLSDAQRMLTHVEKLLEEDLAVLTGSYLSAKKGQWEGTITIERIDAEVQPRFANIEEIINAATNLRDSLKRKSGDAQHTLTALRNHIAAESRRVAADDIEDIRAKLAQRHAAAEQQRKALGTQTLDQAIKQQEPLLQEYAQIVALANAAAATLTNRVELVDDVEKAVQRLLEELKDIGGLLELKERGRLIDFTRIQDRMSKMRRRAQNSNEEAKKCNNNPEIAALRDQLLAMRNANAVARSGLAVPASGDSVKQLDYDAKMVIEARARLNKLRVFMGNVEDLQEELEEQHNASVLGGLPLAMKTIKIDITTYTSDQQRQDYEILAHLTSALARIAKLSDALGELHSIGAKLVGHWRARVHGHTIADDDGKRWACLWPHYNTMAKNLDQARRFLHGGDIATREDGQILAGFNDFTKAYEHHRALRDEAAALMSLCRQLAIDLNSLEETSPEQYASVSKRFQQHYENALSAETFSQAEQWLARARSVLHEQVSSDRFHNPLFRTNTTRPTPSTANRVNVSHEYRERPNDQN